MSAKQETFVKGDRVRLLAGIEPSVVGLSTGEVYIIGAVQPLSFPDRHYVDSHYWDAPEWSWARDKTRLQVAGHPQVIFLEGISSPRMNIPPMNEDPEGQGRCGFSGAWFEKV